MSIIWHNGALKEDGPVFTASDRIRLGDGVFDTMLCVDGQQQHAQKHFERLHRHAAVLKIEIPHKIDALTLAVQELISQQNLTNGSAVIRTIVTRGPGSRGIGANNAADIQIVLSAKALPPAENMPSPNIIIAKSTRRNELSPLSQIKSLQYGDNILAKIEADEKSANDAILLNTAGALTCTTTGNLYVMKDGKLLTPPQKDGVIDGVIRSIALKNGWAEERSLYPEDLENAEGLYLSNSLRGIVPISTLNGVAINTPPLPFRV